MGFLLLFEALRIDGVLVSVYGAAAKGFWLTCMCVCNLNIWFRLDGA